MKTQPILPLQLLALSVLLLPAPPQLLAETNGVQPRLKAVRQGDNVALEWVGGPGIRLQKSGCLCGPTPSWQEVPGSETNCSLLLPPAEEAEYFRLVDANADTDDDLLARGEEEAGWTIFVDTSGYGESRLLEIHVTSDPELEDTDGDGLTDGEEWISGTNPRTTDTDHDGLSDYEEVFRWLTSPTSADTDGDARGPNHDLPPKAALFDGNELAVIHTSPSLDDTDGDGRTDYEEYHQLGRNPLVAEVPKLGVQLVDAVDIRLDVVYAEEVGAQFQYGGELKVSDAIRAQYSTSASMEWNVKVGTQTAVGIGSAGVGVNSEVSVGGEVTVGFEVETTKTVETSQSKYTTDSQSRTETSASGSMSAGIRLVNTGPVTYTMTDLGMTVRYVQPPTAAGAAPSFQTLATLLPTLGTDGITLAPGDSTPILQVQATGLNASRVKQFMARPNSLYLEPAFYEQENAEGLNFDFLEEVTRWRTARVQIDYGNGTSEDYRVATNVELNDGGSYAGVRMGRVMSQILNIPFQTTNRQAIVPSSPSNERVLFSVRGTNTLSPTNGFWSVAWSGEGMLPPGTDFENVALHAGDRVLLVFVRDDDRDGLFAPEEQHYGTSDTETPDVLDARDSDADGLPDVFEVRTGWDVVVGSRTNHVYSDPRTIDQDGDGLTDLQEFNSSVNSTDPTRPDTDGDGLPDNVDPHPLFPAKVLYVKADAVPGGSGANWATALTNLQDALSLARTGLGTATNATDDVGQIWVAAGVYKPTTTTNDRVARFELVNKTALYGGFSGVETKLSQRNSDPLFNGTVLSGDLGDNDPTLSDNSTNVCFANTNVGPGTILDGFMITGGNSSQGGGGIYSRGYPQLKNLLFWANRGYQGGGLYQAAISAGELQISDCLFLQNEGYNGGGIGLSTTNPVSCRMLLTNCQFFDNRAMFGGGIYFSGTKTGPRASALVERCRLRLNVGTNDGGGIYVSANSDFRVSRSQFEENTAAQGGGIATGSGSTATNTVVEAVQTVFFKNTASNTGDGGAINIGSGSATVSLYVLGSTFNTNWAGYNGDAICGYLNGLAPVVIENSIFWGADGDNRQLDFGSSTYQLRSRVRNSCLPANEAKLYPAAGNIAADPKFVDGAAGNLRLQSGSPCLDRGNNYADYYPRIPGFQLLPATDLDGNWRIVDGNGDGTATVDMGAYERQGP